MTESTKCPKCGSRNITWKDYAPASEMTCGDCNHREWW